MITVVGGGIAGLSAALALADAGRAVRLVDAAPRLGGKIEAATVAGVRVDTGPDAFLARVPAGVALCRRLGLEPELVSPATGAALLWARGRLRPLPPGLVLGVPTHLWALARSGLVGPAGVARAALDVVLPRRAPAGDVAVRTLVATRMGAAVADRLVDPLLGGINAGDTAELSAELAAPQLLAAVRRSRSLLLGLRAGQPTRAGAPLFYSLRGGLARLVDALEAALRQRDVTVDLGSPADDVRPPAVLAAPAWAAAALVERSSPDAAALLRAIEYTSVVLATLVLAPGALPARLQGYSGFLVPAVEGRLLTAASFASTKWPSWAPGGEVVVRLSAGRAGDARALALDDDQLVDRLLAELQQAVGVPVEPLGVHVRRWERAFPRYEVGHLGRVARLEATLARDLPGVALAGAGYRGLGLPACISQGEAAAAALLGDEW